MADLLELDERPALLAASVIDGKIAIESVDKFASLIGTLNSVQGGASEAPQVKVEIRLDGNPEMVVLPASALRLLSEILVHMAAGQEVSVLPIQRELSTFQAADLLNVSRPYLTKLVDEGKIPHRKVGTHRRIPLEALLAFKQASLQVRRKEQQTVADLSQELGLEM